mmetsp:Transcript_18517/g.22661  ORF Transcript_18517/g.22661 Transcript_18517/m.22661 type:complete len:256 (+) Transcript_18517:511-1278(+)
MTGLNVNERLGRRVKKLYFVRHCQGEHNIDDNFDLKDPELTAEGMRQAETISSDPLMKSVLGSDPTVRAEVIVSSPLTRCLQTAVAAFDGYNIPIVPCAHIQESYAGLRPCDTGKPKSELEIEFKDAYIDFSELDESWYDIDPEISRHEETREPFLRKRLLQFMEWLREREEERIVIVGHKGVFRRMFPMPEYPLFKNGEVRMYPIDFTNKITWPIQVAQDEKSMKKPLNKPSFDKSVVEAESKKEHLRIPSKII